MSDQRLQRKTLLENYKLMFFLVVVFQAAFIAYTIDSSIFDKHYPDGPMRLLSVTDLLAGQSWYDTTQYRVLPPEGLNLHWSRLIDGAIAALILFFGLFLPEDAALTAAVVAWPTILLACYVTIMGRIALIHFSTKTATFVIFASAFSPYSHGIFFSPGALDHHNVQLVCVAAIVLALSGRDNPWRRGLIGGGATALSLAVGLEIVPFILMASLFLLVRFLQDPESAGPLMRAFGVTLGVASALLFAAQTGPDEWFVVYCDELSPPVLAVTTAMALLAIALPIVVPCGATFFWRIALAAGLIIGAVALLSPWLQPCLDGPYGNVPPEVRDTAIAQNLENYSVLSFFLNAPAQGIAYLLPLIVLITVLWPTLWWHDAGQNTRLLLVITYGLAIFGALYQVRMLVMGFAMVPLGVGIFASDFIASRERGWRYARQAISLAVLIYAPLVAFVLVAPFRTDVAKDTQATDHNCLFGKTMDHLNDLAPATLFTPMNLGPKVLQDTHHSVTGASYHRSPEALINGVHRFYGNQADMAAAVARTGASYIIVCRGQLYATEHSIGTVLARSGAVDGLREVSDPNDVVRVFEVLPGFSG